MASKAELFTKLFIGSHNYESLASETEAGDKILSRNIVVDAFNFSYLYYVGVHADRSPPLQDPKHEEHCKQEDALYRLSTLPSMSSYAIKSAGESCNVQGVLVEDIVSIHTKLHSSLRSAIELPLQGYTSESLSTERPQQQAHLNSSSNNSYQEFLYTSTIEYIDNMRDIPAVSDIDKHFNIQLRYTHMWEVHYNAEQMFLPLLPRYPAPQIQRLIEGFQSNASIAKKLSKMKELVSEPKRVNNTNTRDERDRCHFYSLNSIIEAVKSMRSGYHVLVFDTALSEDEQLANGKASSSSSSPTSTTAAEEPFQYPYIMEASLIKIANRAGCLLLSKLCFHRLRNLLQQFLLSVVQFVVKKKVVLSRDVEYGLSRATGSRVTVLGYGVAGLRHFWSGTVGSNGVPDSGLIAKLQQINPTKSIDSVAMSVLNDLLTWTFMQLMRDVVDTNNRENVEDEENDDDDKDDDDDDDDDDDRCYCIYQRKLCTSSGADSGLRVWLVKNFESFLSKDIVYEHDRSVVPGSAQIMKQQLDGKSLKGSIPTKFVVAKNIYNAVSHFLSGNLMKNAISQGYQAVSKWVESCRSSAVVLDTHKRSRSVRMNSTLSGESAGIIFKPGR
jgi:hypothetical protein